MSRAPAPPLPDDVAAVMGGYRAPVRRRLGAVRALIFEVAASDVRIGPLQETLKWGEPAYLTAASKSGSTIRLGPFGDASCAVFFNCRTDLVDSFRSLFPGTFAYEGHRALVLDPRGPLAREPLAMCLQMALTYHLRRRRRPAGSIETSAGGPLR